MMTEKFYKYFRCEMTHEEKSEFLKEVDENQDLKKEFIQQQNLMAIMALEKRENDENLAHKKLAEFNKGRKKRFIHRNLTRILRYAAVIAFAVIITGVFSRYYFLNSLRESYAEVEVPQGQRAIIRLQDGTTVWLNSRSKLKYPNSFFGDERMVILDGEGYFSVAKDKKRPFVVKTSRYDVQVLGTKFNVINYSESALFQTTLLEGSVEVYKANDKKNVVKMNPNEQLIMKDGKLEKRILDNQDVTAWESSCFIFENEPFDAIICKLGLYYDVRFIVRNEKALQSEYSGTFNVDDKLENILNAMQSIQKFKYALSSDKKIIYID